MCQSSRATVENAANAVANAVHGLTAVAGHTVFVHRGRHVLWDDVDERLRRAGRTVTRQVLAEDDRSWDPLGAVEASPDPVRLLVFHDPFGPGQVAAGWCTTVRALLDRSVAVAFVDFPHGLRDPALAQRLRELYLTALSAPAEHLNRRALALEEQFARVTRLRVVTGSAELTVSSPWVVSSDWTAAAQLPILQLPAGEVWLAFNPDRAEGEVRIARAAAGDSSGRVTAGRLMLADRLVEEPVVELGIGVNDLAPWLPRTTLAEKAAGRVHLGFGDNTLLGGRYDAPVHFDFTLGRATQMWGELDDGSRVRIHPGSPRP